MQIARELFVKGFKMSPADSPLWLRASIVVVALCAIGFVITAAGLL